jgi:hypothetical protein
VLGARKVFAIKKLSRSSRNGSHRPVIMWRIAGYGFGEPDGSGAALKNAELTTHAQHRNGSVNQCREREHRFGALDQVRTRQRPLQWDETLIFTGLAVVLTAFCFWWVRGRLT